MTLPHPHETTVVVFGASGFLGRYIVQRLAHMGYRVRAACRTKEKAFFLQTMGVVGQIACVSVTLEDEASISQALSGAHVFVNAIGTLFENWGGDFKKLHIDFPERLARCAQKKGCQTGFHISALGASLDHASAYARSKAEGERRVQKMMPQSLILRPSLIFGAEDHFFNVLASLARFSPALPCINTTARFQPVYVMDVAYAVETLLRQTQHWGKTFECAGPESYSLRELIDVTLHIIERRRLILPIPFFVAKIIAKLIGWLPFAPITLDQIYLLAHDNCVSPQALNSGRTLEGLAIHARSLREILSSCLHRFRPGGEYNRKPTL